MKRLWPDIEFRVWEQGGSWFSKITDRGLSLGNNIRDSRQEAIKSLSETFDGLYGAQGYFLKRCCECGLQHLGAEPFDIGHSRWCPVRADVIKGEPALEWLP